MEMEVIKSRTIFIRCHGCGRTFPLSGVRLSIKRGGIVFVCDCQEEIKLGPGQQKTLTKCSNCNVIYSAKLQFIAEDGTIITTSECPDCHCQHRYSTAK